MVVTARMFYPLGCLFPSIGEEGVPVSVSAGVLAAMSILIRMCVFMTRVFNLIRSLNQEGQGASLNSQKLD